MYNISKNHLMLFFVFAGQAESRNQLKTRGTERLPIQYVLSVTLQKGFNS